MSSVNQVKREETWITNLNGLHETHPGLKEAYEQIQTVRTLIGYKESKETYSTAWERAYFKLEHQADFDEENPAVTEAWEKYYMLKTLFLAGK